MVTEHYSISQDFPNGLSTPTLRLEIIAKSEITTELSGIMTEDDDCAIIFNGDLSTAEKTALDEVVAAHTGIPPYPQAERWQIMTSSVRASSAAAVQAALIPVDGSDATTIPVRVKVVASSNTDNVLATFTLYDLVSNEVIVTAADQSCMPDGTTVDLGELARSKCAAGDTFWELQINCSTNGGQVKVSTLMIGY